MSTKKSSQDSIILLKWFWKKYFKKYFLFIVIATVFMAIEGSMVGFLSYSVKLLFDNVFLSGSTKNIIFVGLLIFGIFSLRALSGFIQGLITSYVVQKVNQLLQSDLTKHLLKLDISFYSKNSPGVLIERVRVDTQKVTDLFSVILMTIGRDGVSLTSLLFVAFWIDWKWTIIAFIGAPILVLPIIFLQKWIRKTATKSREIEAKITVKLDEIFHGIKEIKLNNIQNDEIKKSNFLFDYIRKVKFKLDAGISGMPAIIDIIAAFGFLGVMVFGGAEIVNGKKTVGDFMSFFTAMALTFEPLRRLSSVSGNFQIALASIDKLYFLFAKKSKIRNDENLKLKKINDSSKKFNLAFNKVNFFYDTKQILNEISFDINTGEKIAFVGSSGAGKTTILNLFSRLIEPNSGSITINQIDINELELNNLRNLFSVVSQETNLFDESIKENIMIGNRNATKNKFQKVLQEALIDEFLKDLPNGVETNVGPRGSNLSGGQKQRILIARAMLRDRPILMLDEPTSSLDANSEILVQNALDRLSSGKTTIIIAHKISSVINADIIYVLNNGRIIQRGSHKDLMKNDGYYKDLAFSQSLKHNNF